MAKQLTTSEQQRERFKVPHKGIDCVSIRQYGKHVAYSCYHCLPRMVADIEEGNQMEGLVELWKPPVWSLDKTVVCAYSELVRSGPKGKVKRE